MTEHHKPNSKGTKVLFSNPIIERLSRTHISFPLTVFSLISICLLYWGVGKIGMPGWQMAVLFVVGLLTFTLIEYLMHRYLFHLTPSTPKREELSYKMHGVHHDYPKDKDRLAMPIPVSILLAALFFFFYKMILGNYVFGFLPGFFMGYASYLWVHFMVHAFQPPSNFFKVLWVHHGIHHYKQQDRAFGVSSPLWDLVFRTMPSK